MENSTTTAGDVRIVSRRLVQPEPESSPPPEVVHLTPWDLQLLTVDHNQYGVLLPKPPQTEAAALVDDLASSLARALGRFYPLAGRLTASSDLVAAADGESSTGTPGLVVSLCCSGEGAELVHAVAPGVTVRDVTASLYTPPAVQSMFPLSGLLNADAVVRSLPVLAAQVTELADGVFVGVSLNHAVGDGTTCWHFLNAWSEINRKSSISGGTGGELSTPPPALDRWVLGARPAPIPLPLSTPEDLLQRRPQHTPTRECFFHFSAESVKNLKEKANAEMAATNTGTTISSLQSVLAHLWRAACRARGLTTEQETTHKLVIGLRGRVPGIPHEYVGSPVTFAVARATVKDVLDDNGLGHAAWLLNRAVAEFDEAKVSGDVAAWGGEKPVRLRRVVPSRNPARLVTSGSPRFDVYGNDFGWGRPLAVRSGAGDKVDGKVMVFEGRDGGMGLEVCLSPEAVARLVADEEFMEAVTVSC